VKRVLLVALALFALLVTLLVLAPATWLDSGLQRSTRGVIGLADARGSFWRGSGALQAILPSGDVETLESIRWTIDPWALLTARAHLVALSERDGKPVLDATLSASGVTVTDMRLEAPAALLGLLSATVREAGITGRIAVKANGVHVDGQSTRGVGDIVWSDAGSSLTSVYPLGTYRIVLQGVGTGLDLTLFTQGGALDLTGKGRWQPGSPLSFSGTATPAPDRKKQLAPLLRIIGKETGGESYEIVLDANAGLAGR
jgi:general secretion pathway protein N